MAENFWLQKDNKPLMGLFNLKIKKFFDLLF